MNTNNTLRFEKLHPSAFIFAAQLILLVVYAIVDESHPGRVLLSAFSILILVLAVWAVNRSPATNWVAWLLAVPAVALIIWATLKPGAEVMVWANLLEGLLYFYTAGSLIAYMLSDYQVTTDELFAIGATFTLMAWGYAYVYLACQGFIQDSFVRVVTGSGSLSLIDMLSLSFTNLTATGISDVLPANPWSKVLIMLTQFTGVGYVAIVVSRLVGLTLQGRRNKKG
ncbi:MAG: hypothetical protein JW704_11115 [Anaerolineaceae bacterium]|nr:hypothetical protein [Anaerolineaceae bacterium]MBN2676943.1 hypothetical protein [Anaerolineaceae bacterium]